MKKLILVSAVLLGITFVVMPLFPQGGSVTTVTKVPLNYSTFVPCANDGDGEVIDLSGTLNEVVSTTVHGNQGMVRSQTNLQGFIGTGLTTGTTYHASGISEQTTTFNIADYPFEITFVNRFRLVGGGTNSIFSVTAHITVNADGEATVYFDKGNQVTCK